MTWGDQALASNARSFIFNTGFMVEIHAGWD